MFCAHVIVCFIEIISEYICIASYIPCALKHVLNLFPSNQNERTLRKISLKYLAGFVSNNTSSVLLGNNLARERRQDIT